MAQLPKPIKDKIYKTGQTRGATDDEIFQNRVNRNSTVLIPYSVYEQCAKAPDNDGVYENGFIVLIKPRHFFEKNGFQNEMAQKNIVLGENALLFYETREEWNQYNPQASGLAFASSRINPLNGHYVARVPSTTSKTVEKINHGFTTSGLKGAGIRVYEYASKSIMQECMLQLEYLYWLCYDSHEVSLASGMTQDEIDQRFNSISGQVNTMKLDDHNKLKATRILNQSDQTICPLCLDKLSANGFYNRLEQAQGRDVPDLTVTQLNLFHIKELRTGEFNHRPYNLGWGHHHCNVVTKDSGILETVKWMSEIIDRNESNGYKVRE
jgi:hypothetical protein